MNQRLLYIDHIKALGIILVLLYHCQYVPLNSMLIQGVYAMCVPLFFMVNGYLMLRKRHSIKALLIKNLKILVVMFVWAFISTGVSMGLSGEWKSEFDCWKSFFANALFIRKPYCNHLWFLKEIFVLNLLNPIIYSFIHANNKRLKYLLVILTFCTVRFLDIIICRFANPLLGWQTSFSVLYYVLGFALLDGRLFADRLKSWHLSAIVGAAIVLQWLYNWFLLKGPLSGLNAEKQWVNDIVWDGYNAPSIVMLTSAICLLFQRISWRNCRWVLFVGRYSLAIYVMQTPIQRIIQSVLPISTWSIHGHINGAVLPILTLIICVLLTKLMQMNRITNYLITI